MTLEKQRTDKLEAAKALVDRVKSEGRPMTDTERTELNDHFTQVKALGDQIKQAAEDGKLFDAVGEALADGRKQGSDTPGAKPRFKSLGEAFTSSDSYALAKAYAQSGGRYSTPAVDTGLSIPALKALTIGSFGLDQLNVGGYQELPFQALSLNRPTVAELFGQGTMSGSILTYLRETVATNGAAAVAEGGQKPPSSFTLARVAEGISKIATYTDVPDEVLEDLDQARSYIDGRLGLFVQMEEEDQVLNGSGTAPNVRGLLNTSGLQTQVNAATGATQNDLMVPNLDGLYGAITKVRTVALMEPDAIAISPNDYQKFRLGRDANNQYYAGGPFTGQYGNGGVIENAPLWGLRTVVTPAMADGTALLGAWKAGATVFRKGGITIDATNSDAGKFTQNITTIRAEERVGLAVFRPSAFVKVTFDWTTT